MAYLRRYKRKACAVCRLGIARIQGKMYLQYFVFIRSLLNFGAENFIIEFTTIVGPAAVIMLLCIGLNLNYRCLKIGAKVVLIGQVQSELSWTNSKSSFS